LGGTAAFISALNLVSRETREEAADGLREQAASCRRLAKRAQTHKGARALQAAAKQFDDDARQIDPLSEIR